MGLGSFFKSLFAPTVVVVDYASFPDSQLRELWSDRSALTEVNRTRLEAELQRRGLSVAKAPVSATRTTEGPDTAPCHHWSPEQRQKHLVELGTAAHRGEWDRVRTLLADVDDSLLEAVMTSLVIQPDGEPMALRLVELACDLRPTWSEFWFQLGAVATVTGAVDRALEAYERSMSLPFPEPRAYANVAAILRDRKQPERALDMARSARDAMPNDAISVEHELGALLTLGRFDEARDVLTREDSVLSFDDRARWVIAIDQRKEIPLQGATFPQLADAALQAATYCFEASENDKGELMLGRALRFDPACTEARLELGARLSDGGKDEEALALYALGIEGVDDPIDVAAFHFNSAQCEQRRRRFSEALRHAERCVALAPGFEEGEVLRVQLVTELKGSTQSGPTEEKR